CRGWGKHEEDCSGTADRKFVRSARPDISGCASSYRATNGAAAGAKSAALAEPTSSGGTATTTTLGRRVYFRRGAHGHHGSRGYDFKRRHNSGPEKRQFSCL